MRISQRRRQPIIAVFGDAGLQSEKWLASSSAHIASSTVTVCCTTTATLSRCAYISACRYTDGIPAAAVPPRGRVAERYFAVTAHSWLCTSPSSSPRCTSTAGAPSWNCAASVLPDSAVVDDCPPDTAVATASKYPTPTSRWWRVAV